MNVALFKALVAFLPASLLVSGSAILFLRQRSLYPFMQLLGAGCIVAVVLTHVCEALDWLPGMHWGLEHSAGHYVDLAGAVLGLTLFPAGYLLDCAFSRRSHTSEG
jgi:hypothetical protein